MTWRLGERAGRIFAHVSDGIIVVDHQWRILHVNPEGARILQRDTESLIGRALWEEFPEAVGTEFWESYNRALARQEPETVEAYYGPLEGWFEMRVFPAPEGLTLYFRNVTQRRAAEEERRHLIGRLTEALRRSEQLLELSDALARALTLQDVADLVAYHAQEALGCRFAGIALIDEEGEMLRYVSMAPLPDDVARKWTEFPLTEHVPGSDCARRSRQRLYTRRSEIVADYPEITADLAAAGTEAMAVLPLVASGRTIGSVMATWAQPREFDEDELRFLRTLAGQAALALERAELLARRQGVAATLQHAILPQGLPTLERVALAARYEPAESGLEVGGDWYDAFTLPDGRLALTVGDVAGHGVDAAALMAQLRNAARAYACDGDAPSLLVTKLNRLLASTIQLEEPLLATLVFAVLDPRDGDLRWSNAGHVPPVVTSEEGARLLEAVHGPPLGVEAAHEFGGSHDRLGEDVLLLYTDGLIEARYHSLTEGLTALLAAAADTPMADLGDLCKVLPGRVLIGGEREDDMCLLAARCTS